MQDTRNDSSGNETSYFRFKRPTKLEIAGAALIVAVVVAGILAYRGFGSWLVVRDEVPERVDVVFTFGGERERERYSHELFKTHPEATWIVSTFNAKVRTRLLGDQVDTARIVMVDTCSATWSEVLFLREWLSDNAERLLTGAPPTGPSEQPEVVEPLEVATGVSDSDTVAVDSGASVSRAPSAEPGTHLNVVLVSSPYHMRRIKVAVVRLIDNPRVKIHYVPAPFDHYESSMDDYRAWWRSDKVSRVVKLEATKILYYLVRL